jgi:hypothetical protein
MLMEHWFKVKVDEHISPDYNGWFALSEKIPVIPNPSTSA